MNGATWLEFQVMMQGPSTRTFAWLSATLVLVTGMVAAVLVVAVAPGGRGDRAPAASARFATDGSSPVAGGIALDPEGPSQVDGDAPVPAPAFDELVAVEQAVAEAVDHAREATVVITHLHGRQFHVGSGVLVDPSGLVMTAGHVIARPGLKVEVTLPDGRAVVGRSLGMSLFSDAGLIRLQERGEYPSVEIAGEESTPAVGDWCFALGHPGGPDSERGVVLRLGRVLETDPFTIRSSCTILGGDSGGPLFDLDGRLIGIHSRISTEVDENYHVSTAAFRRRWAALLEERTLGDPGGMLGVVFDRRSIPELRVAEVRSASAAAVAGIRPGDIFTHVNGERVNRFRFFKALVAEHDPTESVTLHFIRGDERLITDVMLSEPIE